MNRKRMIILGICLILVSCILPFSNNFTNSIETTQSIHLKEKLNTSTMIDNQYFFPLEIIDFRFDIPRGYNSNFSNMLGLPNGSYNVISEQNSNPFPHENLTNVDYDVTYNEWGSFTPNLITQNYPFLWKNESLPTSIIGRISTTNDGARMGWFYPENVTSSSGSYSVSLKVLCEGDGDDELSIYYDNSGGAGSLAGTIVPDASASYKTLDLGTLTASELNTSRIYLEYNKVKGGNIMYVWYYYFEVSNTPYTDYEFDMEYHWEDYIIPYYWEEFSDAIDLCIYTNSVDSEPVNVQFYCYNSSQPDNLEYVDLGTGLTSGWNNFSIKRILGDPEKNCRLYTTDTIRDSNQDSWEIDTMMIHIYNITGPADNDSPTWDTLTESADPLELGNNETININIYDASSLSYVYIEIKNHNYSMNFISGNTWRYSNWLPTYTGNKYYQIFMSDIYNNKNQTGIYNITVIDTTPPEISNVIESADPLYLGNNETITCDVTDYSTIIFVYLEFAGSNHSMIYISGDTYSYSNWLPLTIGLKNYTIWAKDNETNINWYYGNITVIEYEGDNNPPTWDTLIIFYDPLEVRTLQEIWINVYDDTNISIVYIEFDGKNHTMGLIYNDTYTYTKWRPKSTGIKTFTIWMIDYYNNINSTSGEFLVISSGKVFGGTIMVSFLMILMIFLYAFIRNWLVILTVFAFSMIFGIMAIGILLFPLTPYLQIFFILFQGIFFLLTSIKASKFKKK